MTFHLRSIRPHFLQQSALAFSLSILTSFSVHANEQLLPSSERPYRLPEGVNFFSIDESSSGSLEYQNQKILSTQSDHHISLKHLKHTSFDERTYLIWKFVPVGIGYVFDKEDGEVSAEWEMKYEPSETLFLSPNFSGKRKTFWNPKLGSETVIAYSYHYFSNPKPSYWDLSLKFNLIYLALDKLKIGAFLQPEKFLKGAYSSPGTSNPFPYEKIFAIGTWAELDLTRSIFLKSEASISFLEERTDTYHSAYALNSAIGMYF